MSNGLPEEPKRVRTKSYYPSFIRELTDGKPLPMPEGEKWIDTIKRISVQGRISEIDKRTYWHFLEVLPPRYLSGDLFAFAEGMESLLVFWMRGSKYYCRHLSWKETRKFCQSAGLPDDYWAY